MKIEDIQKLETARQTADTYGRIHLLKEGGFYRAHDWSAWTAVTFPINDAWKQLNIVAKKMKDGYVDAFVGIPQASLEKYVPNDGTVTFVPVGDEQIDIMINVTDDILTSDYDTVRKAVDDWKSSLPITESKKQGRESREVSEARPRITRISDVIQQILSFPLESKSPMEAFEFLRQLRQDVVALF